MSVLVDTSVWADFFNGHPSPEAETLTRLIEDEVEIATCGVVLAEFFQGIRQEHTLRRLQELDSPSVYAYNEERTSWRPRAGQRIARQKTLWRVAMSTALTATELRRNIYRVLDQVLETGLPQEILRHGKKLLIVSPEPERGRFENAPKRNALNCSFDELVATSWEDAWDSGS